MQVKDKSSAAPILPVRKKPAAKPTISKQRTTSKLEAGSMGPNGRMIHSPFLNGPPPEGIDYTVVFAIVDGKWRRFWKRTSTGSGEERRVSIEPSSAPVDLDDASDTQSYSDELPLGDLREAASPVFENGDPESDNQR